VCQKAQGKSDWVIIHFSNIKLEHWRGPNLNERDFWVTLGIRAAKHVPILELSAS
jgi:hypothetical protein